MPKKPGIKADPKQWSRQSRQSYGAWLTTEYVDLEYFCCRCGKADVFTAAEQKQSYEEEKNYFWQRRILCRRCWQESNAIRRKLKKFQERWAASRTTLRIDLPFLRGWLDALVRLEEYGSYPRTDRAKKNMLAKLIAAADAKR